MVGATGLITENSRVVVVGEYEERIVDHFKPVRTVDEEGPFETVVTHCTTLAVEKVYEECHSVPSKNPEEPKAPAKDGEIAR